jgi:hypothetical protein
MRQTTLSLPEVGIIAATRGMAGAGAALLLAHKLPENKRRAIGWPLFLIGALSTVPLVIDVIRKSKLAEAKEVSEPLTEGRANR